MAQKPPAPGLDRQVLLAIAPLLAPFVGDASPGTGMRFGDLLEGFKSGKGDAPTRLREAVRSLAAAGAVAIDRGLAAEDLGAEARVLLLLNGLEAAREALPDLRRRASASAGRIELDLGPGFSDGVLDGACLRSDLPALDKAAAASDLSAPALLMLVLHSRWFLNVQAAILGFLAKAGFLRIDTTPTSTALATRYEVLQPFVPALFVGRDGGQRTIGLVGPLPPIRFCAGDEELARDAVIATLEQQFRLKGMDPLARVKRNTRGATGALDDAGGGADDAVEDGGGDSDD